MFLFDFCDFSKRKERYLYYCDLRERVLRSECRQQEEVYFQLAGYALQADHGDHPLQREGTEVTPYFEPKDYFPPWVGVLLLVFIVEATFRNLKNSEVFTFETLEHFNVYET